MITGEINIATTWAASTSFIPFSAGMQNAHDHRYGGVANRGIFATTAFVQGVWEAQKYEEDFKNYLGNSAALRLHARAYKGGIEEMSGMGGPYADAGNAFSPGTIINVEIRKLKALKSSPNRSGIQVNRRLVKGNKLVFRYVARGELVRP
ncbi:MAG: hypothetical protein PHH85_01965 [Candidatus Methanoperedens sp.]|nr:hypothetical protein [Candidatus Methanoperedens sp.]